MVMEELSNSNSVSHYGVSNFLHQFLVLSGASKICQLWFISRFASSVGLNNFISKYRGIINEGEILDHSLIILVDSNHRLKFSVSNRHSQ